MAEEIIFAKNMEISKNIKWCDSDLYTQRGGYFNFSTQCKCLVLKIHLLNCVKLDELITIYSVFIKSNR